MRITFEKGWNGTDAVVLENEALRAAVLPAMGGKTASLILKETSFDAAAENTRGVYRERSRDAAFADFDASGLDDAFPTVDPSLMFADKGFRYTDHGEIWRSRFTASEENSRLVLRYISEENPFSYQKTVSLDGSRILYEYEITNTGAADFPCLWTWHGLVRYEPDMRLVYPKGTYKLLNTAAHATLGKAGTIHDLTGGAYDFFRVPREPDTSAEYHLLGRMDEGACGYVYPRAGVSCMLSFDCDTLPFLCFWVTAGGFRGDYNCAFEPSNGFGGGIDIAAQRGCLPVLHPGETLAFTLAVTLSRV